MTRENDSRGVVSPDAIALEHLLGKISEFYDEQVSSQVKSLTSLIEPLLIGVMGFFVGGIVLAVFLPIFEIQKKLSSGG